MLGAMCKKIPSVTLSTVNGGTCQKW